MAQSNDWDNAGTNEYHPYQCAFCGEENEVWVDASGGPRSQLTEDCTVCCVPISSLSPLTAMVLCSWMSSRSMSVRQTELYQRNSVYVYKGDVLPTFSPSHCYYTAPKVVVQYHSSCLQVQYTWVYHFRGRS
jgi:hypothetical protein